MTIWQTNNWKNLILKSNQASKVFENDIFVEKRSLGLGQFGLFSLGIGAGKSFNEEKLIEVCKNENCLFIQLETFDLENNTSLNLKKFTKGYYKKFITPFTALIDLSLSEEEILASMKQKGRYNINLAAKKGVEVFVAEKNEENIKIFYELMLETTSRDGFSGNNLEYYKNFLEIIPESSLIFTKIDEKILSAGIFVFEKNISIYYYGASTSDKEYRNLMAPYLMQWFAIKKAKSIGSKYYDFLGVANPDEENSPLAGVTDFKLKFTPDVREVSKSYIFINQKIKYNIFKLLKKIKSKF